MRANLLFSHFVRTAVALLLTVVPTVAAGQVFRFRDVPWGIGVDSARARMEALGFRHVRTDRRGDLHFRSDADVVLVAGFADRKLAIVSEARPVGGESLDARFAAVTDSLKRLYGPPTGPHPEAPLWERGFTWMEVQAVRGREGEPARIHIGHYGPAGWEEELRRQGKVDRFPPLDSTWVVISRSDEHRGAMELGSISRQPEGSYRVRMRRDYTQAQPDPPGPYHTIIVGVEVDCAKRRTRSWLRSTMWESRVVQSDRRSTPWSPEPPASGKTTLLDSICAYVTP
jgi:hypothetical protein